MDLRRRSSRLPRLQYFFFLFLSFFSFNGLASGLRATRAFYFLLLLYWYYLTSAAVVCGYPPVLPRIRPTTDRILLLCFARANRWFIGRDVNSPFLRNYRIPGYNIPKYRDVWCTDWAAASTLLRIFFVLITRPLRVTRFFILTLIFGVSIYIFVLFEVPPMIPGIYI